MQRKKLSGVAVAVLCALTLAACGKQAETQVDRVAMEAKAKAESEARAVEAAARQRRKRRRGRSPSRATSTPTRWSPWR
jgi:putative heme iron utilization protein